MTEQELKSKCTPDIIKSMVKLAEGFEWDDEGYFKDPDGYNCFIDDLLLKECTQCFSTLIHRAVEGINKKCLGYQRFIKQDIGCLSFWFNKDKNKIYKYYDYQPQSLTHCECAMLHCLIDILKDESK